MLQYHLASKISHLERDNTMLSTILWQNDSLFYGRMIFPLLLHDSVTEDIHLEVEFTTKHNDYFYKKKKKLLFRKVKSCRS